MRDYNALAQRVHEANLRWWRDPATHEPIERNKGEMLMLMVSELAEAMEGARKNLRDDHLPGFWMEEVEMADFIIRLLDYAGGWGYELQETEPEVPMLSNKGEALLQIVNTVTIVYTCDDDKGLIEAMLSLIIADVQQYCSAHNLALWPAFEAKMAYNATRQDHTDAARLAEGGKKW
jgi:hypothetical protein